MYNHVPLAHHRLNGDGSFLARATYGAGWALSSVAAADFNADGFIDLAVASGSNEVEILLSGKDGTFGHYVTYATGNSPESIAVGEWNGDGRSDLAVADYLGDSVSVLQNAGDGTFAPRVSYSSGAAPTSVTVGDWNADGYLDICRDQQRFQQRGSVVQ